MKNTENLLETYIAKIDDIFDEAKQYAKDEVAQQFKKCTTEVQFIITVSPDAVVNLEVRTTHSLRSPYKGGWQ